MLVIALAARFLLEMLLLLALAIWGFRLADSVALGLLFSLAAASPGALIWGLFISPKRRFELGRTGAPFSWNCTMDALSVFLPTDFAFSPQLPTRS